MNNLIKLGLCAALALSSPAFAADVTLRPALVADGAVTLGDIFEGAGSKADVVISPVAGVLDTAQLQRIAMQHGLTWANETGLRRITVRAEGAPAGESVASSGAPARSARGVEALTWARNINAGEIIRADDLTWATVPVAPSGAADDAEMLIGKAARRPLRSGGVAADRDVTAAQVIKKDDMVTITFVSGPVQIQLQAKAKESAAIGESFDFINAQSGKVMQAIAAGPGRAVVGPEAERLRTLILTDPSRLALR